MPRRKSLTRRFLQHLLLISLARAILNVVGRGRAYDDWDEGKLVEPAVERSQHERESRFRDARADRRQPVRELAELVTVGDDIGEGDE